MGIPDTLPRCDLMTTSVVHLIASMAHPVDAVNQRVIDALHEAGLFQSIRLAMVELEDLSELFRDDESAHTLAAKAWVVAKTRVDGWTKIPNIWGTGTTTSNTEVPNELIVPPMPLGHSLSAKTATLALSSFTRRLLTGKPARKSPKKPEGSVEKREQVKMEEAVAKVHEVFVREAHETPRFMLLGSSAPLALDMQKDVYRMGSMSYKVVARKAAMAQSFFNDIRVCGWHINSLSPFMVAAWTRGRVSGGQKSAARSAKQTLQLVSAATSLNLHIDDPMVKGQLAIRNSSGTHEEPPVKAKDIDIEHIIKFEELVWTASTPQHRCYAGFFSLLGGTSLRASDALRTKKLRVVGDAVTGVSRMKAKKSWTNWFADKTGFSGRQWAVEWLEALCDSGLPGPDFVLKAANNAGDEWTDRPAEYGDVRRMLHLMLIMYMGVEAEVAVTFNPHGFRHVLVTAGQQLKSYGVVKEEDLERLGHWVKGSAMPRNYDVEAGVSEMSVRVALLQQIRQGWRPAGEGCLPSPPVAERSTPHRVANKKRKMVHAWQDGTVTKCGKWRCGTDKDPSIEATFEGIPDAWAKCRTCW